MSLPLPKCVTLTYLCEHACPALKGGQSSPAFGEEVRVLGGVGLSSAPMLAAGVRSGPSKCLLINNK